MEMKSQLQELFLKLKKMNTKFKFSEDLAILSDLMESHKKDIKLKFSDYLTVLPHKDEYLLAQGILGKMVIMKKKLLDEVARNLNVKGSPEIEKAKKELRKISAIVLEGSNEQKRLQGIFNMRGEGLKRVCRLTLVLTLRCNFACVYCYEEEKKMDITKEIIDKSLNDLFERARKHKPGNIRISFFGGEPLLCLDKLEYAVLKVRAFCKENRIKPVFEIFSNGSIYNPRIAELFSADKDLEQVQITIDGPREVHDQRRMFKGGKGSYDVIMKNIPGWMRIARKVPLRINVDEENASYVPELLKELMPWRKENLLAYLGDVKAGFGRGKNRSRAPEACRFRVLESKFYALAQKLGLPMARRGFPRYQPLYCAASFANPEWIAPDGEMYCCSHELGSESTSVGNIFSGYDETKAKNWLAYNVLHNEKCLECKHIFFCGGPCLAEARKGRPDTDLCGEGFKQFLEKNFEKTKKTAASFG